MNNCITQLTVEELMQVGGAGIAYEIGYAIGSGVGYFVENVMLSDGWIDDVATLIP